MHTVHDRSGNVIAESDAAGQTVREVLWLPEGGYAGTDLPLAVVDGVNTASPVLYHVHADHLGRPIRMTDGAKAAVWQAVWQPWGAPQSITGSLVLNQRFPGQWFQLESGLHYNWHRHYDPSLGRYTQPDPLGFVDGPGVYGYVKGNPQTFVDRDGRFAWTIPFFIRHVVIPAARAVVPAIIAGLTVSRDTPAPDTPAECLSKRCQKIKRMCIDFCSDVALPGEDGWKFFKCLNRCMKDNGCPSVAD